MQMNAKPKTPKFNPAVLPMEYMPSLTPETPATKFTKHYLIPGKVFVSAVPIAITTILGSGVSVCLWDCLNGIGGINHFLWPAAADAPEDGAKDGETANKLLLQQMLDLGADMRNIEAKIFGGSQPLVKFNNSTECLGNRNVEVAVNFLSEQRIPIAEKKVGGSRGRKLIFQTTDGLAEVEQL